MTILPFLKPLLILLTLRKQLPNHQLFLENLKPPYYALKQFPVRFRTRGGAVVDESGRLLDGAGKAIPGVYCCGAAAQGGGESLTTNGAFGIFTGKAVASDLGAA